MLVLHLVARVYVQSLVRDLSLSFFFVLLQLYYLILFKLVWVEELILFGWLELNSVGIRTEAVRVVVTFRLSSGNIVWLFTDEVVVQRHGGRLLFPADRVI